MKQLSKTKMQFIHDHLCQKYAWYDRWHAKSQHKHYHWAILLLASVAMASLVLTGVSYTLAQTQDVATTSLGRDFYVDPSSGNDVYEGRSPEAPWKTLSRIADYAFEPGDKIYLKKGYIFREELVINSSGTFGNPIFIGSYGQGADPIVSAFDELDQWVHETGNKYSMRVESKPVAIYEDGTLLKYESKSEDFNATGEWYFSGDNQVLVWTRDGLSPYEHEIAYQARSQGLVINNQDFITVEGIILAGSDSSEEASAVVINSASFITLRNNTFLSAERSALSLVNTRNVRVEGNQFRKNAQVASSSGSSVISGQDNLNLSIVKNNFTDNFAKAISLNHTVNGSLTENHFTGNIATVVELFEAALTTVSGNDFSGNGQEGQETYALVIENSLGSNVIVKNLIAGQLGKAGMLLSAAQDTKVYSNVLYGNQESMVIVRATVGLDFQHNTLYGLGASLSQNGLVLTDNRNLTIRNNIIFDALHYAIVSDEGSLEGLDMDYNDVVGRRGIALWKGVSLVTLQQFRQVTGQGSHSTDFNPGFASIFEKDFRLNNSSPLIDRGALSQITEDFDGIAVPQGTAPDIGAYERED